MIDLYYFMKVHYRGKKSNTTNPNIIYQKHGITSATIVRKYIKEIHKGNYANDQIVVGG